MKNIALLTISTMLSMATAVQADYPTKNIAGTYKYQEKGYKGTMNIIVDGSKYSGSRLVHINYT